MSEMTSYVQGTPCWVDLYAPDLQATKEFYTELFGWTYREKDDCGGYIQAMLNEKAVAGLLTPEPERQLPVAWRTYLAADNVDDIASALTENGGRLLRPPSDIGQVCRICVALDSTGAAFGVWQSGWHHGAQLVNEPGALTWSELLTKDAASARQFYATVFGVANSDPVQDGFDYTTVEVNNKVVAGIWQADDALPAGVPPYWSTYFGVADTDATAAKVLSAGGKVTSEPRDTPYGRMARFLDSQGAAFSVMSTQESA